MASQSCYRGEIPLYANELSGFFKTFGLGAFSFISGYVLYYQKSKNESFITFLQKKATRILIPCVLFALVYDIFFPDFMFNDFPSPINGTHLWYLPMLFICLCVIAMDVYMPKLSMGLISIFWLACVILYRFVPIRTISECFHYLPVISVGYLFNKYGIDERLQSFRKIRLIAISGGGELFVLRPHAITYHI